MYANVESHSSLAQLTSPPPKKAHRDLTYYRSSVEVSLWHTHCKHTVVSILVIPGTWVCCGEYSELRVSSLYTYMHIAVGVSALHRCKYAQVNTTHRKFNHAQWHHHFKQQPLWYIQLLCMGATAYNLTQHTLARSHAGLNSEPWYQLRRWKCCEQPINHHSD